MTKDEELALASERLLILQRADAFLQLMDTPGWKDIYSLHVAWVEKYRDAMLKVDTANPHTALESLRQWQLAEEFVKLEADYINNILREAQDIRGSRTLQDALLMEQVQHEQNGTESRPDRAGY